MSVTEAGSTSATPGSGSSSKVFESAVDDAGDGDVRGDRRIVGEAAERGWEDEHLWLDLAEDERDLLESVEGTMGTTVAPRNADAQNVAAASIQFGSWKAITSPGRTALCQAGRGCRAMLSHVGERAAPTAAGASGR